MVLTETRHGVVPTSLGAITLVASADALTGVYFPGHWTRPPAQAFGTRVDVSRDPVLAVAAQQIQEYLAGERRAFGVRTATHGDVFQERVWALLRDIPYGATMPYGELARRLGGGALPHEVGQAVGRNPLSIVVPCHRVVGKDGKLTGYAGGLERKRTLLDLEGHLADASESRVEHRGGNQPALLLFAASGQ